MNPTIQAVTQRIIERSKDRRQAYLAKLETARRNRPHRGELGCSNLAHGFAACSADGKQKLSSDVVANVGIITAYNDMLSAHAPFSTYPDQIKAVVEEMGATAQVAGAVPAMCDGVTQGQPGMELSLFSRDVIAQAAAIGLSHNMFDSVVYLGVCDKIVPGLLIGALTFGHIPAIFAPAGPMTSGLSNEGKAEARAAHARGEIGLDKLLEAESAAYHSVGTCTFYGTANSNQMMMEVMGLHPPGGTFANPGTDLRTALTREAAKRATVIGDNGDSYRPIGWVIDERAIVNAIVGLMATGGSTNHTIHLIAIARAAGVVIDWQDMADISAVTPLLTRVYPNGKADVNHFDAAGGIGFVIRELLASGHLHGDATTVWGETLADYGKQAKLGVGGDVTFIDALGESADLDVVRPASDPFQSQGGLQLLKGNLGRSVIKISAVAPEHQKVTAPAQVFTSQEAVQEAFKAGQLHRDVIVVLRDQGPKANGMPELHKLTTPLKILQDLGFKVAFVTDGRMSGASGKVPSAIHLTPEALDNGPIARIQDGDIITLDAAEGVLSVDADLDGRSAVAPDLAGNDQLMGRELFGNFRAMASPAEQGATTFGSSF